MVWFKNNGLHECNQKCQKISMALNEWKEVCHDRSEWIYYGIWYLSM